jgi:hypothetical protein
MDEDEVDPLAGQLVTDVRSGAAGKASQRAAFFPGEVVTGQPLDGADGPPPGW